MTIGGSQEGDVDLPLPLQEGLGILVLIADEGDRFTATALSHDVFLNGSPLTTAEVYSGDEFTIKGIKCRFEGEVEKSTIENQGFALNDEEIEQLWQSLQSEPEKKEEELQQLLFEAEEISSTLSSREPVDEPVLVSSSVGEQEMSRQGSSSLLLWCLSAVLFLGLFSVGSFLYLQEKNEREEIMAARGIADLSMSLTHARLHSSSLFSVLPILENELPNAFLTSHFEAILPAKFRSSSELDPQGHLKNSSYQCQVYSSRDLSRFLLIAEPKAGWLQSLFPKPFLIITSQKMEVRRTFNIRPWLELLGSAKSIEAIHPKELHALANQQELLPLTKLDYGTRKEGFSPPHLLAQLRPDAENRIYNAPRYALFTLPLLQRALELVKEEHDEYASAELRYLAQQYSSLDDLILYTSEKVEKLEQVQEALQQALPTASLLVGTITAHPQSGDILSSELLSSANSEAIAKAADSRTSAGNASTSLYATLAEFVQARRNALQPISQQMTDLLSSNNSRPLPDFMERLDHLTKKYLFASQEQSRVIERSLESLCQQFGTEEETEKLPLLVSTIKATGLEPYIPLSIQQKLSADPSQPGETQLGQESLTPEARIKELLHASFGFLPSASSLTKKQEEILEHYTNAKAKLSANKRRSQYKHKVKQFKKSFMPLLYSLRSNAQNLQQASQELDKQMHLYLQKLRFSAAYFPPGLSEAQRIEKIKMAEQLESQVHLIAFTLSSINQGYQMFVEEEIAELNNDHPPTAEKIEETKQKQQNLFYPSHAMESTAASLQALFAQ